MTIKAGKSVIFEVPFTGAPQPTVTWTFKGGDLVPNRMTVETIRNMTCLTVNRSVRSDAGDYTLVLENNSGRAMINITLNVLGKLETGNLPTIYMLQQYFDFQH